MKIGITGHRKLKRRDLVPAIYDFLIEQLKIHSEVIVNCGMAVGFDQLVCEVICKIQDQTPAFNISFNAVVPFVGQEKPWPEEQQEKYKKLLSRAKKIVVVSDGDYEAWKMHKRNKYIVDNSDAFLVYWDGLYSGGTGACMKLIKNKKLEFVNLYS